MLKMLWVIGLLMCSASAAQAERVLRVMTFNIWDDGNAGKQPLQQSVAVIKAARADVVGLQEAGANAAKIAKQLGWNYVSTHQQTGRGTVVLSKYPLEHRPEDGPGVRVRFDNRIVWIFNVHFAAAPYQPYQLLKIPYGDGKFISTEEEAIAEAKSARGADINSLVQAIKRSTTKNDCVFVTGDFNEPSHLDWTTQAIKVKRHPIVVRFPTTRHLESIGFVDAYRNKYSDEVKHPGFTWTPLTTADDEKDHHDRIDYVFGRGPGLKVVDAQIVGESSEKSSVVVEPYPSDHRAVVAEYFWATK